MNLLKSKKIKFDSRGFTWHYLLPVIVIAIIAIAGVRILIGSHAASTNATYGWTRVATYQGVNYIDVCRVYTAGPLGPGYDVTVLFVKSPGSSVNSYSAQVLRPNPYGVYSPSGPAMTGTTYWHSETAEKTLGVSTTLKDALEVWEFNNHGSGPADLITSSVINTIDYC